jgi:transmembrane sensor
VSAESPSTPQEIRAVRFLTRRHSGDWTAADKAELRAWLRAHPENVEAYNRLADVWVKVSALEGRFNRPIPRQRPRHLLMAVAAGFAVIALVPVWHRADLWWNGRTVHWVTQTGKPQTIVLSDRTKIVLDADSQLAVRLGARVRRASLTRGAALFVVEHDAWRPFEVETGNGRITDLGTRFEVEKLHDNTRVQVLQGEVGLSTARGEVHLLAGHASGYDNLGTLQPVREVDTSADELWTSGQRSFEAVPLAEVIELLERYHPVTFTFADPQLGQVRLSGTFRVNDLALFLSTLGTALSIESHWTGPRSVELSRP